MLPIKKVRVRAHIQTYKLRESEHNYKLVDCSKHFPLLKLNYQHGIHSYNPDMLSKDTDLEFELFGHHLVSKFNRWDNKRKHILVLGITDLTSEKFNDIYVHFKDLIIKIK